MSEKPTGWLPSEHLPELAPPPPELFVPGTELDPLPPPPGETDTPDRPDPTPSGTWGEDVTSRAAPGGTPAPRDAGGDGADPASRAASGPEGAAGEADELTAEVLATLPVELLGLTARTQLSPKPFLLWGAGLGLLGLVLALVPPYWWLFGLVAAATAGSVGWTAWKRSTGVYSDSRTLALAVLALAAVALLVGLVIGLRFFLTVSQLGAS